MTNTNDRRITKPMTVRYLRDRWLLSKEQDAVVDGLTDDDVVNAEILDAQPFGRFLIRLSRIA